MPDRAPAVPDPAPPAPQPAVPDPARSAHQPAGPDPARSAPQPAESDPARSASHPAAAVPQQALAVPDPAAGRPLAATRRTTATRPIAVTAGAAVLLAVGYLLLPAAGTDLAAQVARANFVAAHGARPVDFSWYGGVNQFGYSLFTAGLGAALGVRLLGAVAALVSAVGFGYLLLRWGARRPVLGGVLGAAVSAGNLVSGRTTFAVGVACGTLALCVLAASRPGRGPRLLLGALLAALATWASPVAGLFTGLAGAALLLAEASAPARPAASSGLSGAAPAATPAGPAVAATPGGPAPAAARGDSASAAALGGPASAAAPGGRGLAPVAAHGGPASVAVPASSAGRWRRPAHLGEALVLILAPAIALLPMAALFGDGGAQPYSAESMRVNVALAVAVFLLMPAAHRTLRAGAALAVVLLAGSYYLPSPIGSNATRLTLLYAVPVVAAFARFDGRLLAAVLAALVWWQPPLMTSDLIRAGSAESERSFYQPLVEELGRRAPIGRIEVVPLRDHWESAYVARAVPLARGWERQVDVDRNALFYHDDLAAAGYADWLRRNAVGYVALAPDAPPDRYARQEAALITAGLPFLREVWRDSTWRLYAVSDAVPLVSAPAQLVESSARGVVFTAPGAGDVLVRVRWSRWLTVTGPDACLAPAPADWTRVRVARPGRYELSSALTPHHPTCP